MAIDPTVGEPRPAALTAAPVVVGMVLCVVLGAVVLLRPGLGVIAAESVALVAFVAAIRLGRRDIGLAALPVLVVGGVICAVIWPVLAVGLVILALVCTVALRAPALGFLGALLLSGADGLLKARLAAEHVPSANALGAGLVDLVLAIALVSLLLTDRGRSLRAVWRGAGRAERIVWSLVGAWLVISVFQIPQSGQLSHGLEGFRVTQAYVAIVVAAVMLFPVQGNVEKCTRWLLVVIALVAGYAALRAAIGPAGWEQAYALSRTEQASFGLVISRDVGSFNSPPELVSYLVPGGVFALGVGFLNARLRGLAWATFVLASVSIIASYVRIGVVAVGVGAVVLAFLLIVGRGTPDRTRVVAVALALVVGAGGYGAALAAGDASHFTEKRAQGLTHPFSDRSLSDRWERWQRSGTTTLHHPLGTGLGSVGRASQENKRVAYTDNSYLKILQEQGPLFGLLFIVGVFGSAILLGRRLVRLGPLRQPVAAPALAAFAAFLTLCFLGEYIELPGKVVGWTMLGIGLWFGYGVGDRLSASKTELDDVDAR